MKLLAPFLWVLAIQGCVSSHNVFVPDPDECSADYEKRHVFQPTLFPRHVKVDPTLPFETAESVFIAADAWNAEMEADVFDVAVAPLTPNDEVRVIQMVNWSDTRIASTGWRANRALVEIREDFIGVSGIDGTVRHELGHSLNLLHEDDPESWMHSPHGPNLSAHSRCLVQHALDEFEALH